MSKRGSLTHYSTGSLTQLQSLSNDAGERTFYSNLNSELKIFVDVSADDQGNWKLRYESMERLMKQLVHGDIYAGFAGNQCKVLADSSLVHTFETQISDLRSEIVRQCSRLLALQGELCGSNGSRFAMSQFSILVGVGSSANRTIRGYAQSGLIIQLIHSGSKTMQQSICMEYKNTKSIATAEQCCELLLIASYSWSSFQKRIQAITDLVFSVCIDMINGKSPVIRDNGASLYWFLQEQVPLVHAQYHAKLDMKSLRSVTKMQNEYESRIRQFPGSGLLQNKNNGNNDHNSNNNSNENVQSSDMSIDTSHLPVLSVVQESEGSYFLHGVPFDALKSPLQPQNWPETWAEESLQESDQEEVLSKQEGSKFDDTVFVPQALKSLSDVNILLDDNPLERSDTSGPPSPVSISRLDDAFNSVEEDDRLFQKYIQKQQVHSYPQQHLTVPNSSNNNNYNTPTKVTKQPIVQASGATTPSASYQTPRKSFLGRQNSSNNNTTSGTQYSQSTATTPMNNLNTNTTNTSRSKSRLSISKGAPNMLATPQKVTKQQTTSPLNNTNSLHDWHLQAISTTSDTTNSLVQQLDDEHDATYLPSLLSIIEQQIQTFTLLQQRVKEEMHTKEDEFQNNYSMF